MSYARRLRRFTKTRLAAFLAFAFLFLVGAYILQHSQQVAFERIYEGEVASCERVNVVRDVLYEDMLVPARDIRILEKKLDTATDYQLGLNRLKSVGYTNDPLHPARVDCANAFPKP